MSSPRIAVGGDLDSDEKAECPDERPNSWLAITGQCTFPDRAALDLIIGDEALVDENVLGSLPNNGVSGGDRDRYRFA